jgi:phage RecT family recombinase
MTARAYQNQSQQQRGQQNAVVKYELTKTQVEQEQMVLARVDEQRAMIETYLPAGVDLAQIKTDIALAVRKVPKILDCTPESILIAAAEIQRWGLQIGTTAYLVPYGTECTPVADYKGLEELVTGSGVARALRKAAVYENDYRFEIYLGSRNEVVHEPMWKGGKRGALLGAYCIAIVGQGEQLITYMRLEEIEVIRKQSKQWKPEKAGPECPEWYAIKTAVRRSCKTLPKNPRLATVMARLAAADRLEFGDADPERALEEGDYTIETPEAAPAAPQQRPAHISADGEDRRDEPEARCPVCTGEMWDSRDRKTNPKAPDFQCKDNSCKGVYWPGQWPPVEKPLANDVQIARLVDIAKDQRVNAAKRAKITEALQKDGITRARALKWIDAYDEKYGAKGEQPAGDAEPGVPAASTRVDAGELEVRTSAASSEGSPSARPPLAMKSDLVDAMRDDLLRAKEKEAKPPSGAKRAVSMGGEGVIPE